MTAHIDLAALDAATPLSENLTIRAERPADVPAREALLDEAFGAARFQKTSVRLRAGRLPAEGLALVAEDGHALIGTVRLWPVRAGGADTLLLGPLAVARSHRCLGVGARLMREATARAAANGHRTILLVGDAPYYARFGFSAALTARLALPGPVERARFLALELLPGSLSDAQGLVIATGARASGNWAGISAGLAGVTRARASRVRRIAAPAPFPG
ncbi:MAG TPA: N-acetyltransferase [Roseiarcus sp.]|jgi:predicted N-acetyltransferase YhbS